MLSQVFFSGLHMLACIVIQLCEKELGRIKRFVQCGKVKKCFYATLCTPGCRHVPLCLALRQVKYPCEKNEFKKLLFLQNFKKGEFS